MSKVYLALYKGHRDGKGVRVWVSRLGDWLTRKLTRGIYSHCEIAIRVNHKTYHCYSASVRDGGVRVKMMDLSANKWDLIPLDYKVAKKVQHYFLSTAAEPYDWLGALGVVLKTKQDSHKFFCSEWCFNALFGGSNGWRFSPNDLAAIVKGKK